MNEKKRWKICMFVWLLSALAMVGGVAAYFTDTDTQVNSFTVGRIEIDLQEPLWEEKEDADDNGIPDEAERMQPGQTISKDPQVKNIGTNEAFIFVTVETPYRNLITVNADGTKNEAENIALYSYDTNAEWVLLGTAYEKDGEQQYLSEKKLYAYADEAGNCIALQPEQTTPTLFDSVTMANIVEGQGIEEQEFQMSMSAYGIQTTSLKGNALEGQENVVSAEAVWKIVSNQNEITDVYTK